MAFNPFRAIGNAVSKATSAVGNIASRAGNAVSSATSKVVSSVTHVVKLPFVSKEEKREQAPKEPKQRAPRQRREPTSVSTPPAPAPAPEPAPPPVQAETPPAPKKLPRSMFTPTVSDERVLGIDSDEERALNEKVSQYILDYGLNDLGESARNFLLIPSFLAIFERYTSGSGFTPGQWLEGMHDVRNIRINPTGDGRIEISFDADFFIDDYDLGFRSPSAIL